MNEYLPDIVSAPGETLRENMEASGKTHADVGIALNLRPVDTIRLLEGKLPLTESLALKIVENLGFGTVAFWLDRERKYRASLSAKPHGGYGMVGNPTEVPADGVMRETVLQGS